MQILPSTDCWYLKYENTTYYLRQEGSYGRYIWDGLWVGVAVALAWITIFLPIESLKCAEFSFTSASYKLLTCILIYLFRPARRVPTSWCPDAISLAVEQSSDLRQVARPLYDVLKHARLEQEGVLSLLHLWDLSSRKAYCPCVTCVTYPAGRRTVLPSPVYDLSSRKAYCPCFTCV